MIWLALLALFAFSAITYAAARGKARKVAQAAPAKPHSRPGQHAAFVAIWTAVPALLVLLVLAGFGGRVQTLLTERNAPAAVEAMPVAERTQLITDAVATARGAAVSAVDYTGATKSAFDATVALARQYGDFLTFGAFALAALLAILLALFGLSRIKGEFRARNRVEGWIAFALILCSAAAILTTVGIVASLLWESMRFFQAVSPIEFLTGLQWSPQIAIREDQVGSSGAFGAVPLFMGTFLIMLIAMLVAGPIGLMSAIFLAEYAGPKTRGWFKPILEILAGVPTVVYGFFAALTVGPAFRGVFNWIGAQLVGGPLDGIGQYLVGVQNQMALVAGLVMVIMLIPFVSSLSDDILNAVPQSLRDGSYAMGATKSETVKKVVLPAALPGVAGAFLLAISRAVGETMIVTMAAGLQAKVTLNPLDTVTTVTVQIVTLLTGDQEFDSPKTLAAFGLGLTLFVVTLILNVIALRIVQAYREQYD